MNLYDELGIKRVLNASATLTKLGGSIMPREVLEAMEAASHSFIDYHELQAKAGDKLAEMTHNEAALVTTGAAAGIALCVAACITGDDKAAIAQLPDLTGLKNEVIIHKSHRNGYDHSARMLGVKVVEIGTAVHTEAWELEKAINANTACILWFQGGMTGHGDLPLAKVIEIANARGVPVIVDGAAQVPPAENLWKFTKMGATAAIFSGGKDLKGPQSSGIVVGKRKLIEAMRMNGSPNHSFGRPFKVGKEEIAGLLAAVKLYLEMDHDARLERDERVVAQWMRSFNGIRGVCASRSWPNEAGQPLPRCELVIEQPDVVGITRDELVDKLWNDDPRVAVANSGETGIFLNPMTLTDAEVKEVEMAVKRFLTAK